MDREGGTIMTSWRHLIFDIVLVVLLLVLIFTGIHTRTRFSETEEKLEALKEQATAMEIEAVRLQAQLELVERLCEGKAVKEERK
jgi:hypothetical protein